MADLPFGLPAGAARDALAAAMDREGKVVKAIEAVAAVRDHDVLVLDAAEGRLAGRLTEQGARVRPLPDVSLSGEPSDSADAVVAAWAGFEAGDQDADDQMGEARRVLRPGGRLVAVQDYGRDDLAAVGAGRSAAGLVGRRRDAWFTERGFKVRVVHAWWTFESVEAARSFLASAFGPAGEQAAASVRRPRLSHKVVLYHLAV